MMYRIESCDWKGEPVRRRFLTALTARSPTFALPPSDTGREQVRFATQGQAIFQLYFHSTLGTQASRMKGLSLSKRSLAWRRTSRSLQNALRG